MTNREQGAYTAKESYTHIAAKIKAAYNNEITDQEAYEALRNLVGLCQEIINYKINKQGK